MANLWVVVTGLTVLVEKVGDKAEPCFVLLRRVDDSTRVAGVKIPPHEPLLRDSGSLRDIEIRGRDVEFPAPERRAPQIINRKLLLPVGVELDQPLKVRPELTGQRSDMGEGGANIARVKFSGGLIQPIHIDKNFDLKQISVNANILLAEALDLVFNKPPLIKNNRRIANGLLFSLRVDSPVVISVGEEKLTSQPIGRGDTGNLPVKNQDDNHVVWIVNTGTDHPADEEFDRDFFLLYDLLDTDVEVRYVPQAILLRAVDTGDGNPPGQCMNGYALG